MSTSGIHSGVGGYDPSLLPRRDDHYEREDHNSTERDTAVTRVAAMLGPSNRPDASPVDRSTSTDDTAFASAQATYGRRALTGPAAVVGHRLDVTG